MTAARAAKTTGEVAEALGVSARTARRWLQELERKPASGAVVRRGVRRLATPSVLALLGGAAPAGGVEDADELGRRIEAIESELVRIRREMRALALAGGYKNGPGKRT